MRIQVSISQSRFTAIMMNLLLPGLGHLYCRDLVFGLFVFLVMIIASVLAFVCLLVSLSTWVKLFLLGMPLLFYLFTFADLYRTAGRKDTGPSRSRRARYLFWIIAVAFQLLAPISPINFLIRNFPEFFVQESNSLAPIFSKGDLLKTNPLSFTASIFFLDKPLLHSLPDRYDVVRFRLNDRNKSGIVLGLPTEEIELIDGILVVDGLADFDGPGGGWLPGGDWPLTQAGSYSILLATLNFGNIDKVIEVPLDHVTGRVSKVF